MNNIDDFFKNAKNHNLCERGAKIWEHCGSKKALIDYGLSAWGMEYLAQSIVEGWGISPESIMSDFYPFINGKYIRDKDGYSSVLYCGYDKDISIDTTAALIINYTGTLLINKFLCDITLVNSKVKIVPTIGKCRLYLYNSTVDNLADLSPNNITVRKNYDSVLTSNPV